MRNRGFSDIIWEAMDKKKDLIKGNGKALRQKQFASRLI